MSELRLTGLRTLDGVVCPLPGMPMHARNCFLLFLWFLLDEGLLAPHGLLGKWHHRSRASLKRSWAPGSQRVRRSWVWNQFFVLEEYMGSDPQYVGKLHTDLDRGDSVVKYTLSGEGAGSIFTIDQTTGDIHAVRRLDREERPFYTLRAQAIDMATGRLLEEESEFVVKVQDINDNEPRFLEGPYTARVPEMAPIGTYVIQVTATDADDPTYGNSAQVVYSILHGQPYFSVDAKTGVIRTALPNMDREVRENYYVLIQAKDMGGQLGGLAGTTTINISLTDVNDNPPRFSKSIFHLRVLESSPTGSAVGRVKANDLDVGKNAEVEYSIVPGDGGGMFEITTDEQTQEGIITLRERLDFEEKSVHIFKVEASNPSADGRFQHPDPLRDSATVRISVVDVAEPPAFGKPAYDMDVYENAPAGIIIGAVSAQDLDVGASPIRYSMDCMEDTNCSFEIDPVKGTISTTKALDREQTTEYNISIVATKVRNPDLSMQATVTIHVLDVNEFAPELITPYKTFVCENSKSGQVIGTISAQDKDLSPTGQRFTFRSLPGDIKNENFTVWDFANNTAGILTQRSGFRRRALDRYLVPVVVADRGYPRLSSTGTLTVRVCSCGRDGSLISCSAEAVFFPAGVSTGALLAVLLGAAVLLVTVLLYVALRRRRKSAVSAVPGDGDIRENVIRYDDEGGGEEDTRAFDIGALRKPDAAEAQLHSSGRAWAPPKQDVPDVRDYIHQRLVERPSESAPPPYDSLATYGYEGDGSLAGSLSPIESLTAEVEEDHGYLDDLGPSFTSLVAIISKPESHRDTEEEQGP
ncbi:cadherin-12-like [Paramormyrops kingsleyae]|uniref:cadherin-12-like n=1 Tax=Paramormyrops kingsleyae TaxID=1676925 RepID=UPI003B96FA1A